MGKTSGALFLLGALLCLPATSLASETINNHSSDNPQIASATTKEELLLFWEEKDLYVQTATRNLKPISQVAENITIVTAKEIEDMNAHTVSEVLNRVFGVFVDFIGQDFGSLAQLHIQGSEVRHVLVLLDGFTWNETGGGDAETITIPVRIIDRIEIIKGPASSAWGSSLGGVVNIITKGAGNNTAPSGSISASYGKSNSQEGNGELFGKAGPVGYYLFAGHQYSNGLVDTRGLNDNSFFAKFTIPVSTDVKINFTAGYSEPHIKLGDYIINDFTDSMLLRTSFATASLDAAFTKELSLQASLHTLSRHFFRMDTVLGTGLYGPAGDLWNNLISDEKTTAGSTKLVWAHGMHTAVLGADFSHNSFEQTLNLGPYFQSIGAPATTALHPSLDRWAIFGNDTITLGKFSITPGVRYDHNDISGSFTSPSLGTTYKLAERTILRASAARGFTLPPLLFTSGGGLFYDPNPSLKPETVWSYQAGFESDITEYLWLKATVFRHDMKDGLVKEYFAGGPPGCSGYACNDLFMNKASIKREGYELELETAPVYNVSLGTGIAYALITPSDADKRVNYVSNLRLKYDDKRTFIAELFGHYIWWDISNASIANMAKYDTFIWDMNIRKTVYATGKIKADVFITGHNLFNGNQYTFIDTKNPKQWFEAGVRLGF